jgi:hypothetical protein
MIHFGESEVLKGKISQAVAGRFGRDLALARPPSATLAGPGSRARFLCLSPGLAPV